jgi:hypothetical protein
MFLNIYLIIIFRDILLLFMKLFDRTVHVPIQ